MIAFAACKINIGIRVLDKRSDGFHHLESILYPVPLYDILEIKESDKDSLVQSGFVASQSMEENIVFKALQLVRKKHPTPPLSIYLHKQIPFGAGLGGGSSDAVSMLRLLIDEFKLITTDEQIFEWAQELGSDCPFFIQEKAAVISGRGEIVKPINLSLKDKYIIIVKPPFIVSTVDAFRHIERSKNPSLKDIENVDIVDWQKYFTNDFEKAVSKKHQEIMRIKEQLLDNGALYASLSGSGSAVFGIFEQATKLSFPSSYFYWGSLLP